MFKKKIKNTPNDITDSAPDLALLNKTIQVINRYMEKKPKFVANINKLIFIKSLISAIYSYVEDTMPTVSYTDENQIPREASLVSLQNLGQDKPKFYPLLQKAPQSDIAPAKFKELTQELKMKVDSYKEGSKRSKIKRKLLSILNDKEINSIQTQLEDIRKIKIDSPIVNQETNNNLASNSELFSISYFQNLPKDIQRAIIYYADNNSSLAKTCTFFNNAVKEPQLLHILLVREFNLSPTLIEKIQSKYNYSLNDLYMALKYKEPQTFYCISFPPEQSIIFNHDFIRFLNQCNKNDLIATIKKLENPYTSHEQILSEQQYLVSTISNNQKNICDWI